MIKEILEGSPSVPITLMIELCKGKNGLSLLNKTKKRMNTVIKAIERKHIPFWKQKGLSKEKEASGFL